MELSNPLPFVVNLDDCDEPADAIDAMVLGGFVAGSFPAARSVRLQRTRADARLLPPGLNPAREACGSGRHARRRTPASRWPGCSTSPTDWWARALEVLVCITTNEELARLHPAITRPGRCAAQLHVGRLSRAEATRWLGRVADVGPEGATLAELCALRGELEQLDSTDAHASTGLYL